MFFIDVVIVVVIVAGVGNAVIVVDDVEGVVCMIVVGRLYAAPLGV